MGESKLIHLKCPVCSTEKDVNIPVISYNQKKFGTSKIAIPPGAVCDHHFLIFVDPKGIIRGYEKIDITMGAKDETKKVSFKPLIKMFGYDVIYHLLHAKVFDYPSYVLITKTIEDQSDIVNGVFDLIIPDFYGDTSPINFIDESEFNTKKENKTEEVLLIDNEKKIWRKPWSEKLKLEERIVQKCLDIIDEEEQLILLGQDLRNFLKEIEHTMTILFNADEIDEDSLLTEISKRTSMPKTKKDHLNIIKLFIERRVQPGLTSRIAGKKRKKKSK